MIKIGLKVLLVISIILLMGNAFSLPINEMNQSEKKDFNLLPLTPCLLSYRDTA
jgi:hypothetical protein